MNGTVDSTFKRQHTIAWKVTGKQLQHPGYLIGTCHAVGKSFLDSIPAIRAILQQSRCLLTELYPSDNSDGVTTTTDIQALPLLDKRQYALMDSFFKATAGPTEGLDNPDVLHISVYDFIGGIREMLLRRSGTAAFAQMDRELYESFHAAAKATYALEKATDLYFRPGDTVAAKALLDRYISTVSQWDEWDISNPQSDIAKFIKRYKTLQLDYQLSATEPTALSQQFSKTIANRNKNWLPKIEHYMQQQPTVVAVGFYHLAFTTGLINLLRADGYNVTPVAL
ncbi:TraB/GumN family protein [Chitinophaga parva]|nr:TraB/GumN family protein [Chitinophaga parva]